MKNPLAVAAVVLICLSPCLADSSIRVGAKTWIADINYNVRDIRSADGDVWMYGPTLSVDLPKDLWLSGSAWFGKENLDHWSIRTWRSEAIVGYSWAWLDAGLGYSYRNSDFRPGDDASEQGPVAYLGSALPLGQTHIAVYGTATWQFLDFTDHDDAPRRGDMSHYVLDAGVAFNKGRFAAYAGVRYEDYYYSEDDFTYLGPTVGFAVGL
jgi:hypothetical protein